MMVREYKVLRELNAGGMGRVYEGKRELVAGIIEPIAIKIPEIGEHIVELREMFVREVQTAIRLSHDHPNLITVFDCGETADGVPFLVMELIDGATASELAERQSLSPPIVRRIAHALLEALTYLAGHGVVHRDISTRNILVGRDGRIKLSDFGLAIRASGSHSGRFRGTPPYASPEHLQGHKLTAASDLFSLGAVLYKLITGHRPFGMGELHDVWDRMKQGKPRLPDDVPDDLARLTSELLSLSPEERPTATHALEILDVSAMASDEEIGTCVRAWEQSASHPSGSSISTFPPLLGPVLAMAPGHGRSRHSDLSAPRHRLRWAVVAAGLVLSLSLSGYALWPSLGVGTSPQEVNATDKSQGILNTVQDPIPIEPSVGGNASPGEKVPTDVSKTNRTPQDISGERGPTRDRQRSIERRKQRSIERRTIL